MSINNSNKPIGHNIRQQDVNRQVGGTYGERRQLSTGGLGISEPQVQRQRDFFKQTDELKPVERFSSNATFIAGKEVLQHKVIEAGKAHPKVRINDNVRLAFLDRIISGPGDNKPPLKSPIKSTIKSTKV